MARNIKFIRIFLVLSLAITLVAADAGAADAGAVVREADGRFYLQVPAAAGKAEVIRVTAADITEPDRVCDAGSGVCFVTWRETGEQGELGYYAYLLPGRRQWSQPTVYYGSIPLQYGTIEPGRSGPEIPPELSARAGERLFIVQFRTCALKAWRDGLRELGAEVLQYLAHNARIVRMDSSVCRAVAELPYVRWIGRYEPAFRIGPDILDSLWTADPGVRRHRVQVFRRGPEEQQLVAAEIEHLGGVVHRLTPRGFVLEADLTRSQLLELLHHDHVLWVDLWSPPEPDMDIIRAVCGADELETVAGYNGVGVRAEVMDGGVDDDHTDFNHLLFHTGYSTGDHGTCTYGIVFGDGTGNSNARGLLPEATGYFADYDNFSDRYAITQALVQDPLYCVFQSNSWGSARTLVYNTYSYEMDDIIYLYDVPILQSQSNAGATSEPKDSRGEAWAKNVISVGGIYHENNTSYGDDHWYDSYSCASIGPAADNRVKPDVCHYYDDILTTDQEPRGYDWGSDYYSSFGGTSGATPIVAGQLGLLIQMWADDVFGTAPGGGTVFDKRPHCTTSKAMLACFATQYPFSGTSHDLTRVHQGWGLVEIGNAWDHRNDVYIIDESSVLEQGDIDTYLLVVEPGTPELKATLHYIDYPGTTSSSQHRINDLSLRLYGPGGTPTYYGNNGLYAANYSATGGSWDTINTVENVFIENPAAGLWQVQVYASEINEDTHPETAGIDDSDYALVVLGTAGEPSPTPSPEPSPTPTSEPSPTPTAEMTATPFPGPDMPVDGMICAQLVGSAQESPMLIRFLGKPGAVTGPGVAEGEVGIEVEDLEFAGVITTAAVEPDGSFFTSAVESLTNTDHCRLTAVRGGYSSPDLWRCRAIGDVNGTRLGPPDWDDSVSVADVLMIRYSYLNLHSADDYPERDANASGSISLADVVLVRGIYLGLVQ